MTVQTRQATATASVANAANHDNDSALQVTIESREKRPRASRKSKTLSLLLDRDKKKAKKPPPSPQLPILPEEATHRVNSSPPWYHVFTKGDVEYNHYMATEWGYERHGDTVLFEMLTLEGAQSGLSWLTILRKRGAYRRVFGQFDPVTVMAMKTNKIPVQAVEDEESSKSHVVEEILMQESSDPRNLIVRHRGKVESVFQNAHCILQMRQEEAAANKDDHVDSCDKEQRQAQSESLPLLHVFDDFLWSFVDHKPILNGWKSLDQVPSQSPESQAMSYALKKRGFRFVGPTTCYSLMQSVGMVIDHPMNTPEWCAAYQRLQIRPGGFQDRTACS